MSFALTSSLVYPVPLVVMSHDSILVFIDKLTKMVHLAPCKKTITAKEAAHIFTSVMHNVFGANMVHHSD